MPPFTAFLSKAFLVLAYRNIETYVRKPSSPQTISNTAAPLSHCTHATIKNYFLFHYSYTMLVINGASVMRITYACVWMQLIRIESEFAGFAFNVLLNLHSCGQAFKLDDD